MTGVDSVSSVPVNSPTILSTDKTPDSSATAQATQVKVSQSQTADFTIVTAEGDTVTLSSSRSVELSFSTYNAQGKVGDSSCAVSGVSAELRRSNDFSFTVDGDLNKEELKEIRTAIRTIQKAATDVLKGHDEKAAARTAKLASLDQIASIDADLEFNRQVSVTQTEQPKTSSAPETSEVPSTATAPSPVSAPSSDASQTQPSEPVNSSPAWTSVDAATTASVATTATAGAHLSLVLQIQAGATSETSPDSSSTGLWWFPSQDLWNTLHAKNDSLEQTTPASEKQTPVTA